MACLVEVGEIVLRNDPVEPTHISIALLILFGFMAVSVVGSAVVLWMARARRSWWFLAGGAATVVTYAGDVAHSALSGPASELGAAVTAISIATVVCTGMVLSMIWVPRKRLGRAAGTA
jgi:hypothetical protein